jgi:dihydrodipicolinate synthase/N-acetylneuraminate lyase
VIAQSNHGSVRIARSLARTNVECGADLVSIAIPRQFSLRDDDLLRYSTPILNGVDVPCLVQDFNPGGPTVSTSFVMKLAGECANFRYLKLEVPLLAPRVRAIREATGNQVQVLEVWGGLYTLELIPAGICGLMPGLAIADILSHVFFLWKNNSPEAFDLFENVLPQICFALQNLELFLYCEKSLLQARGILNNARCRTPAFTPDPDTAHYVGELNGRIIQRLAQLGLQNGQTGLSVS